MGLHTPLLKGLVIAGVLVLLMLLRHGKTITLAIKQGWHRFQAKRKNVLPVDEGRVEQTAPVTLPSTPSVTPCVTSTVVAGGVKPASC